MISRRFIHASRVVLLASAAVLFLALPLACSDDDSGGGISTLCNDSCEHEVMCNPTTVMAECVDECLSGFGSAAIRTDAAATVIACQMALACDASDDNCQEMVQPLAYHTAFVEACSAKRTECDETQTLSFCTNETFVKIFTEAVIDDLSACIAMSCEQIQGCIDTVATKYGLD